MIEKDLMTVVTKFAEEKDYTDGFDGTVLDIGMVYGTIEKIRVRSGIM